MSLGARAWGHPTLLSWVHQQGAVLKVDQPGLESMPIKDARVAGSDLTHWEDAGGAAQVVKYV